MSSTDRTAVVMMDTRPVHEPPKSALQIQYPHLAFELNRGYACMHGYDLLYLHMQSSTCEHLELGTRHPSYCKLAAVAEALHRGYDRVAFLDSDAFFKNVSLSLTELEKAYGDGRDPSADVSKKAPLDPDLLPYALPRRVDGRAQSCRSPLCSVRLGPTVQLRAKCGHAVLA